MTEPSSSGISVSHQGFAWWFRGVAVPQSSAILSPTFDLRRGYPPDDASLADGAESVFLPTLHVGEVWEISLFAALVGLAQPIFRVRVGPTESSLIPVHNTAAPGTPGVVGGTESGILLGQFCNFELLNVDVGAGTSFTGGVRVRPA